MLAEFLIMMYVEFAQPNPVLSAGVFAVLLVMFALIKQKTFKGYDGEFALARKLTLFATEFMFISIFGLVTSGRNILSYVRNE
jgi:hypothetical protein